MTLRDRLGLATPARASVPEEPKPEPKREPEWIIRMKTHKQIPLGIER